MNTARRVAVVTGAARGFGQAISVGFARQGIDTLAVDLVEPMETIAAVEAAGARCVSLVCDVAEPEVSSQVESALCKEFGRCDILVNNAGIYPNVPFPEVDYELWRRVQRINLDSQYLMVKGVLAFMIKERWGRIVNVTSNSIGLAIPGLTHYMASKMAVIGFTRGLSCDVAEYGVTVNAVGPTASLTPGGIAGIKAEHIEELAMTQAIKRAGRPEDIVGTVMFLASEESAWVTGQTIMADGGLVRL